jgi:hypothetical protein
MLHSYSKVTALVSLDEGYSLFSLCSFASVMEKSSSTSKHSSPNTLDFRPKYPLDPFATTSASKASMMDIHDPWLLSCEHLPATSQPPRRDVIFILGSMFLFPDIFPLFLLTDPGFKLLLTGALVPFSLDQPYPNPL